MNYCKRCSSDTSRKEYVQCCYCKTWTHSTCNKLSSNDVRSWNVAHLKFVCRSCAFSDNGAYDVNASLVR